MLRGFDYIQKINENRMTKYMKKSELLRVGKLRTSWLDGTDEILQKAEMSEE